MGWGYHEYTPVSVKKAKAEKALARLRKKNPHIRPVIIEGRKIAKSWWGVAWNENLESYADYDNRLERGRSYVKNGMVLDLQINKGIIGALVQGTEKQPYKVQINIDRLSEQNWENVYTACGHKIAGITELLEGKFPKELAETFMRQGEGLFPKPKEIHLSCSCYDWADMCKHVAAALYGVSARLDDDPLLFFTLRDIDFNALIKKSVEDKLGLMLQNAGKKSKRIIKDADIERLFGI